MIDFFPKNIYHEKNKRLSSEKAIFAHYSRIFTCLFCIFYLLHDEKNDTFIINVIAETDMIAARFIQNAGRLFVEPTVNFGFRLNYGNVIPKYTTLRKTA